MSLISGVDSLTEALSFDGWKKWNELEPGMKVYGVTSCGDVEIDHVVKAGKIDSPVEVIEFSQNRNNFSAVATPNQRFSIQLYNSRDKKHQSMRLVEAGSLKNSHQLNRRPLSTSVDREKLLSDDLVRLLAWVVTEGSYGYFRNCKDRSRITLTQSRTHNPDLVAEIQGLLDRMGGARRFEYDYHDSVTWTLSGKVRQRVLQILPDKQPTWDLLNTLTIPQMRIFLRTSIKGDGSPNNDVAWLIGQKERGTVEVLQAMATLVGLTATLYDPNTQGQSVLNVSEYGARTQVGPLNQARRKARMAWGISTQTGRWISRREGTVLIVGGSSFS